MTIVVQRAVALLVPIGSPFLFVGLAFSPVMEPTINSHPNYIACFGVVWGLACSCLPAMCDRAMPAQQPTKEEHHG